MVEAAGAHGLPVDLTHEQMKSDFGKNPKWFKPPAPVQDFNIYIEAKFHDTLVHRYEQRKWQIVVASDNSGGFVTSDHPICLRWCDGRDHGFMSPGFGMPGTEVIFSLSPKLALRGLFDVDENVIQANKDAVAGINSLLVSTSHNQVYGRDALFSYKRGPKDEVGSGAHLFEDKVFLAGGRDTKDGKVVALKPV